MRRIGRGGRAFDVANGLLLTAVAGAALVPMVHVRAKSTGSGPAILSGRVGVLPVETHASAYVAVIERTGMVNALLFTIYLTVVGTVIDVLVTALGAYPLSKRGLVGKRAIRLFILFTMYFSGGLIPLFLVVRALGLLDTVWALILPGAISTFNLILMKTYFSGIPESLTESARMDGGSELLTLFRIVIPVSTPIIATFALFYGGPDDEAERLALSEGFFAPLFKERMPVMMKRGPGLIKIRGKYWVKMIVEDDFDSVFDEFVETLEARGVNEIVAERTDYFGRHGAE